ncbi:MAG: hypothetical protein CBB69_008780 [Phycisphaera sp. TMED9]|nr:MAG: hypothetical protein CBB69_008780 [Phycisphaera sp. TMED9]
MSSMTAPVRRSGGDLDVYTGLLFAAFIVLTAGVISMAMANLAAVEPSADRTVTVQSENVFLGLPGFDVVK